MLQREIDVNTAAQVGGAGKRTQPEFLVSRHRPALSPECRSRDSDIYTPRGEGEKGRVRGNSGRAEWRSKREKIREGK